MRTARLVSFAFILSLVLELSASASMSTKSALYAEPKLTSGQQPIHSACILPIEANLFFYTVTDHHPQPAPDPDFAKELDPIIATHMQAAGFTTTFTDKYLSAGVQQAYETLYPQIEKKPKNVAKGQYTLGPDVAKLTCAANTDVLVIPYAEEGETSGGIETLALMFNSTMEDGTLLSLAVVDARSGEVIAFIRIQHFARGGTSDPEKIYGPALDKELNKIKPPAPKHP